MSAGLRTNYSDGGATPAATNIVAADMNAISAAVNSLAPSSTPTTASATTLVLTATSDPVQIINGSTTQLVTLPSTGVAESDQWLIVNNTTASLVTVQASGGGTAIIVAAGTAAVFTATTATPTTAAAWLTQYAGVTVASGEVANVTTGGTVFTSGMGIPIANLPDGINNANSALQSQVTVAGTAYYMTNSQLLLPTTYLSGMSIPGGTGSKPTTGTTFHWQFAMTKTAAGTGAFNIIIYRGTNGTTSDAADVTQSIGTQTAAVDHMTVDVQLTVTTTGSAGAYWWSIIPMNKAVTATGFGCVTGTLFSGSKTAVALNTAGLVFGLGFSSTTGTPTITIPRMEVQAFNVV